MRFWHWLCRRGRDLFYGPDNLGLDLGRCIVAGDGALMGLATLWNIHLHKEINLGPGGLGGGLGTLLSAGALLIAAKDRARTNHIKATQPQPQSEAG
jgi:hypothetical protein